MSKSEIINRKEEKIKYWDENKDIIKKIFWYYRVILEICYRDLLPVTKLSEKTGISTASIYTTIRKAKIFIKDFENEKN